MKLQPLNWTSLRDTCSPSQKATPATSSCPVEAYRKVSPRRQQLRRPFDVTRISNRQGPHEAITPLLGGGPGETETFPDDSIKKRKRVEAVLFLSKSSLSPRKLAQLAHLADATEARTLVRELNSTYESFGRAIRVEQIAGGYRLMTRPALAPWLSRLGHVPPPTRLSTPMMETMAVVAYRQPVSRADIEAIRGVACGELLRQLMEKDLVRIAGRSEELGRPYLYGTTRHFLQLFGLANAESLPPIQWHTLHEVDSDTDNPNHSVSADLPEQTPTDNQSLDPSHHPSFSSTKESVVSTAFASVLSGADSELLVNVDPNAISVIESHTLFPNSMDPHAAIEDEEDELYGDDDDEEDDDWDDDDDEDDDVEDIDEDDELEEDDLEEDDVDDEEDDVEEDEVEDDEVEDELEEDNADWEEVDDDEDEEWEDDEEDEDDWDDDEEEEDDDEDWS